MERGRAVHPRKAKNIQKSGCIHHGIPFRIRCTILDDGKVAARAAELKNSMMLRARPASCAEKSDVWEGQKTGLLVAKADGWDVGFIDERAALEKH